MFPSVQSKEAKTVAKALCPPVQAKHHSPVIIECLLLRLPPPLKYQLLVYDSVLMQECFHFILCKYRSCLQILVTDPVHLQTYWIYTPTLEPTLSPPVGFSPHIVSSCSLNPSTSLYLMAPIKIKRWAGWVEWEETGEDR